MRVILGNFSFPSPRALDMVGAFLRVTDRRCKRTILTHTGTPHAHTQARACMRACVLKYIRMHMSIQNMHAVKDTKNNEERRRRVTGIWRCAAKPLPRKTEESTGMPGVDRMAAARAGEGAKEQGQSRVWQRAGNVALLLPFATYSRPPW